MRHLFRVMRGHDMTKKFTKTNTKTNTKTKSKTKTQTDNNRAQLTNITEIQF